MEEILAKLLVADNSTIIQGTQELREAFKSPEAIPALCNVLSTSNSVQIRQYAAVILRRRLSKNQQWCKLSPDIQNSIKQGILQLLINEKEKLVKNSVAQFIGTIAKHELNKSNWPELMKLIHDLMTSSNKDDIELGVFTLSILTEVALELFSSHPQEFSLFFTNIFQAPELFNSNIGYYTIVTMIHTVSMCETDPSLRQTYHRAIPCVIEVVKSLAATNDDKACDCMELFDEISEFAVPLLVPHVQPIIVMCLDLAKNKNLGDNIRNKALTLVGWITRIKKKSIMKHKLIKPIVDVLFALMCEPPEDDDHEDYFVDDDDDSTPTTNATHTLDVLALHLPPEKLISHVLEHVSAGLAGDNPYVKKASYLALAMLAEGCAECIRNKYLKQFLECVRRGIVEPIPVVRNAALYALGQFSENLQPEISEYAAEIMPILISYLAQVYERLLHSTEKQPPGVDRIFYALEVFCETLEDGLLPYLPDLMEHLLVMRNPKFPVHVQELALSAIGSAAISVKTGILPFFPRIFEHLKMYLLDEQSDPENLSLQVQAIESLGLIARTLGPEHFTPLAKYSLELGLKWITSTDDPDLRKATYGLFAALSTVMKEDFSEFLPKIIELMIESLKSTEGIVSHYKDDEDSAFPIYDDLSDTPDEEDIDNVSEVSSDSADVQYSVENSYIEEKEAACAALKDIAQNTGPAFLPYLENSFQEVLKLVNYPQEDIRKASIETLAQFCVSFSQINSPEGQHALYNSLSLVVPKCSELIRMDEEREVSIAALEALSEMLKEIKEPVLKGKGHKDAIMNCLKEVLTYKTQCQDKEDCDTECEDAEQDELLLETAGDVIPHFGRAMEPAEFVICMSELMPILFEKFKKKTSLSQRSFFVGTVSECFAIMGGELGYHAPGILQIFLPLAKDEHEEVRNNAIYGIGELALHTKQALYPLYSDILATLSNTLSRETHSGTIDNICGAVARLVITNVDLVPMDQVFPVFIQRLPLREDFEEHAAVLKCFGHLYQLGHPILLKHIPDIIQICCKILHGSQGKPEVLAMAAELLKTCQKDFPTEFGTVMQSLPPEISMHVNNLLSATL